MTLTPENARKIENAALDMHCLVSTLCLLSQVTTAKEGNDIESVMTDKAIEDIFHTTARHIERIAAELDEIISKTYANK